MDKTKELAESRARELGAEEDHLPIKTKVVPGGAAFAITEEVAPKLAMWSRQTVQRHFDQRPRRTVPFDKLSRNREAHQAPQQRLRFRSYLRRSAASCAPSAKSWTGKARVVCASSARDAWNTARIVLS